MDAAAWALLADALGGGETRAPAAATGTQAELVRMGQPVPQRVSSVMSQRKHV